MFLMKVCRVSESFVLEMFPTQVAVTLRQVDAHPCPPEEFREKMMVSIKDIFSSGLEEEPWSTVEATLWYVVQRLPLFKEKRMMVKLRNICDDREGGKFVFKVYLCKRPEIYPSWNLEDPVSDDEKAPANPFFCMQVNVKLIAIDSLQKMCGLVVSKVLQQNRPLLMPKKLAEYVQGLTCNDLCF